MKRHPTAPRIFFDARFLRKTPGGVATYTAALAEHLPKLAPNVPFVFLRHPDAPPPLSSAPNVTELVFPGDPNAPPSYLGLGAWLRSRIGHRDLFHAPYRILPLGAPPSSIITMHDCMQIVCPELVFPNPVLRSLLVPYWSMAIRSSIRRVGRILAVSQHSADDTIRIDPSSANRIRVTHLGVDPVFTLLPPAEALERTKDVVPEGRRFFLVLGGGYPNKNHAAAVFAFARAFTPADGMHLVIIQRERTFPPELERVLRQTGLFDRTHVLGKVSISALVGLYGRADALIFPSLYEGFGLPVLEAMACGCPVVASTLTSVPEVAGDAALLCDPRDRAAMGAMLRQIASDESLRNDLAVRGRARAAAFQWSKTAEKTLDAYREMATWIP